MQLRHWRYVTGIVWFTDTFFQGKDIKLSELGEFDLFLQCLIQKISQVYMLIYILATWWQKIGNNKSYLGMAMKVVVKYIKSAITIS